jgi:hypothetical protein
MHQPSPVHSSNHLSDKLVHELEERILTLEQMLAKSEYENKQYEKLHKEKDSSLQRSQSQLHEAETHQQNLQHLYEEIQSEFTSLQ